MTAGVYLYCVGRASELTPERVQAMTSKPADRSDAAFRVIQHGELAALVSDTDVHQFDIQREQLMAHHHVLEEAMGLGDILPVSYGTVAEGDEDVAVGLLERTQEQLLANLEHVSGRVELALRVMWDQDRLFEEIVDQYADIRQLRDAIAGVPEEQSLSERIQLGELTAEAIELKRNQEAEAILEELEPLCVDLERKQAGGESILLNVSFLVPKEQEPEFDEAVQRVAAPREGRMMFRYLGPLPPASFVSVTLDNEG